MKNACPGPPKRKGESYESFQKRIFDNRSKLSGESLEDDQSMENTCCWYSAIGVALSYAGFGAADQMIWLGVTGIVFIIFGFVGAAILNLGIKNGRQNVNRILNAIESEPYGK